jgi:hypothetical protein
MRSDQSSWKYFNACENKASLAHLLETEILAIVAEATAAHEQAVLANEAVRVRADATVNQSVEVALKCTSTHHDRLPGPYLRGCEKKMFA